MTTNNGRQQRPHYNKLQQVTANLGFTLVELLVVIAIFSLLAAVGVDILAPMIRAYNKANIQNEVNQNGRYVLSLMEQQIRNAKRVVDFGAEMIEIEGYDNSIVTFDRGVDTEDCPTGKSNGYLRISRLGTNLLDNAPLTNRDLTKGVNVVSFNVDVNNFVSPNVVSLKIQLSQACNASGTVDYKAEAVFSTTVTLRNY